MATAAKTARSRRTRTALVAAVHDRLAADGAFTAEEVAADAGCTPATFWAHFGTKDDAVAAAFETALDDLVALTTELFEDAIPADVGRWADAVTDRLIGYFAERALLYRAAIARFPEHRGLRRSYRDAEQRAEEIIAAALGPERDRNDAVAVLVFCQGLNNPGLLRSGPASRVRRRLADALATLVGDEGR
ncbi:MAG: TetR/AcrR family transcriptional regulator [Actinomycetota bacterium]